jgi:hypothetical protein
MHDAMPVFSENKNCTVTQTRRGGGEYTVELHIYTSGNQIREYYMARVCDMHQRSEHMILMGKAERKTRDRFVNKCAKGWKNVDWIHMAQTVDQ